MVRTGVTTTAPVRMKLRKFPLVHRPLQWANRKARPTLWGLWLGLLRKSIGWIRPGSGPVRGTFSDADLIRSGKVEGRIVLEEQGQPRLSVESIMVLCGRTQHQQQPWPVLWAHHRNARLLGPSLAHLNGRSEISEEACYGKVRVETDPAWWAAGLSQPTRLEGNWTSIIGQWLRNDGKSPYAHWLLDAFPRLAALKEFPADTGILVPPNLFSSQIESLKLLGVWERCRSTPEQHLVVENFYFSSPPSMIVCYSPYAVKYLRETFLPMVGEKVQTVQTPRRFFIRRTSVGRNMTNEAEVLRYFEQRGWAIVDTARLGFLEQVYWFAQAEAVCAIHGSGTANMVWCSAGCQFIELFAADYLAGDQEWIAQCVDVEYHFMIFPCDYKLDATIDLAQVEEKLKSLELL